MGVRMNTIFGSNRWTGPPGSAKSKHAEIHLWRVDLDRNAHSLLALESSLAPEERAKASAFRLERDRNRYIMARGALRTILAWYLKAAPGELVFRCGVRGRPELADDGLRFNTSRSHDLALYAVSRTCEVGVDVERIRSGIEEDVVRCFCSRRALRYMEALPQPVRRRAFFQGWTRMEAYQKARGEGLKPGLENFERFLHPSNPALLPAPEAQSWCIYDFFPRSGYIAAVAAGAAKCKLYYWKWQVRA